MKNNFEEKLIELAKKIDIKIEENDAILYGLYKKEIEKWSKKVNLTSIKEDEEFIVKHIIDSLMLLKKIKIPYGAKIIDVGTGAGFPGIPLKIFRKDVNMFLLDSNKKKVDFLESAIKNMGLKQTYVLYGRAENYGRNPEYRESFDFALARAVSALNVILELCLPFVKIGGFFIALKGKEPEKEVEQGRNAAEILGGEIKKILYYKLPDETNRSLVVVEKIRNTPDKYPRRDGMPEKRPIL